MKGDIIEGKSSKYPVCNKRKLMYELRSVFIYERRDRTMMWWVVAQSKNRVSLIMAG
jgi:hypothetical protein